MEIQLCMILEYCVHGDLRNLIDEFQQLPESEKLMRGWEYTAQITRALDHLHSHNVMHRDLQPANILVNQDGSIRLGDFGLASEMNEDYYNTIAGTKAYMAPEVHLLKRMNKSSEIFSLGVILFQLVTGHHPFQADSEEAMIDKIKKNKVSELPDWVSNQMKEVIKWMMNIDENHRPTTKMILSHDTVMMSLRSFEGRKQQRKEKINSLTERYQERIEKNIENAEINKYYSEYEYEKRSADTNVSQELVKVFQQQFETAQSEIIRLTTEVQLLAAENARINKLLQSVPPSLSPQVLIGIIPNKQHDYQEGLKIIRTNKTGRSTIAFNPVISSGIVRFQGIFEKHHLSQFSIGIAESSAVFGSNEYP
ncbi:MAG: putative kinase family protein, partial [Streblomastix strix]